MVMGIIVDEQNKKTISKKTIIICSVIISVVMYLAGVFSGLYANKITEHKVNKELTRVEQDIEFLKNYIDNSALDLKNVLLLQFYSENFENSCAFSELYLEKLHGQLQPFWDKLPYRLEQY